MVGNVGADFHPDLGTSLVEAVFRKGADSGFEGVDETEGTAARMSCCCTQIDVDGVTTKFFACAKPLKIQLGRALRHGYC